MIDVQPATLERDGIRRVPKTDEHRDGLAAANRQHPSAEALARLDEIDRRAARGKLPRGNEAGKPAAGDEDAGASQRRGAALHS